MTNVASPYIGGKPLILIPLAVNAVYGRGIEQNWWLEKVIFCWRIWIHWYLVASARELFISFELLPFCDPQVLVRQFQIVFGSSRLLYSLLYKYCECALSRQLQQCHRRKTIVHILQQSGLIRTSGWDMVLFVSSSLSYFSSLLVK